MPPSLPSDTAAAAMRGHRWLLRELERAVHHAQHARVLIRMGVLILALLARFSDFGRGRPWLGSHVVPFGTFWVFWVF